jgi:hypothetical protein
LGVDTINLMFLITIVCFVAQGDIFWRGAFTPKVSDVRGGLRVATWPPKTGMLFHKPGAERSGLPRI